MKPLLFHWDGESMVPFQRHRALADKQYVVGQTYCLLPQEQRSIASHRQYFAALNESWLNLPEDIAEDFASAEHLRKWALIRAGFRDERTLVCSSRAEARRIAAFIKPLDEFAVVIVRDALVVIYTAKSQSLRAMGKAEFQRSKDAVLNVLAQMIGTDVTELNRARAA